MGPVPKYRVIAKQQCWLSLLMQGCAGCAVPLGISSNVHPKYSTKAFKRFASLLLREPEARTEEFLETEMARLKVLFGGGSIWFCFGCFLRSKTASPNISKSCPMNLLYPLAS